MMHKLAEKCDKWLFSPLSLPLSSLAPCGLPLHLRTVHPLLPSLSLSLHPHPLPRSLAEEPGHNEKKKHTLVSGLWNQLSRWEEGKSNLTAAAKQGDCFSSPVLLHRARGFQCPQRRPRVWGGVRCWLDVEERVIADILKCVCLYVCVIMFVHVIVCICVCQCSCVSCVFCVLAHTKVCMHERALFSIFVSYCGCVCVCVCVCVCL